MTSASLPEGYGRDQVIAPNMDRLARQVTVFERAYCQMAICSPSRSSLMTGLRPDSTGVFDLATHFRAKVPDVVTLPQHFKNNGYHTQAVGKNFHPAFSFHADVDGQKNLDDPSLGSVLRFGCQALPGILSHPGGHRRRQESFRPNEDEGL